MAAVVRAARWVFTPSDALNYGFIAAVYAALSAVSGALALAQYGYGVHAVTGFWIVPAPCAAALVYVLILRALAGAGRRAAAAEGKTD